MRRCSNRSSHPWFRSFVTSLVGRGAPVNRLFTFSTALSTIAWHPSATDREIADAPARSIHALCPSIDGTRCAVIVADASLAVVHSMCREIVLIGGVQRLIPLPIRKRCVAGQLTRGLT